MNVHGWDAEYGLKLHDEMGHVRYECIGIGTGTGTGTDGCTVFTWFRTGGRPLKLLLLIQTADQLPCCALGSEVHRWHPVGKRGTAGGVYFYGYGSSCIREGRSFI